ncbi:MAG: ABC transporter ATP-binding protein [Clostridia bacterium]|nr:ABC transporter ATP-binding protein [Clostridia bacterium]
MNAIEIRNVSKKQGEFFELKCEELILPRGCIMGLVGKNGAGKSTLIHLLLGMIRKDGGEISLLGAGDAARHKETLEEVGVVLDYAAGIPGIMKVTQVSGLMRGIYKHWDSEAFDGYLNRFEIPHSKKSRVGHLSRGMLVKLNLAIALSHGAKLLILDEATNGLDALVRDEVIDLLMEFTREEDRSVLISSHMIGDLEKICDYVAFLRAGKLALCEEKDQLRERYLLVRGTAEQLAQIPDEAVLGRRGNAFGAEAIVERTAVTQGMDAAPVPLEELFIMMEKEASAS